MPSFDVVSEVDLQEVRNAVDQASRELHTRFDFKGTDSTIDLGTGELTLRSSTEDRLKAVRQVLEKTPPELASDIIARGMVMTGGGALLRHIDELLTQVTGIPCFVADNPMACVAVGTGMALENLDVLRDSLSED